MSTAVAVIVFVVAYLLIATEKIPKTAAALGGAGSWCSRRGAAEDAFYSEDTGVDWNVIFLLLGMMIIVGVLRRTGVFEFVGDLGGQAGQGLAATGDGAAGADHRGGSAFLDNVTTVLLIAPVTLLVCDRLASTRCRS